jgi:hypothetical protein
MLLLLLLLLELHILVGLHVPVASVHTPAAAVTGDETHPAHHLPSSVALLPPLLLLLLL